MTIDLDAFDGKGGGLDVLSSAFDAEHQRLFSFLLDTEHEVVTIRATVSGPRPEVIAPVLPEGSSDPAEALINTSDIWADGGFVKANIYDRVKLKARNVIHGPAIVTEMDSTTLVLPGHTATVHRSGSILIQPLGATETLEG